jgi:hypothetical protein
LRSGATPLTSADDVLEALESNGLDACGSPPRCFDSCLRRLTSLPGDRTAAGELRSARRARVNGLGRRGRWDVPCARVASSAWRRSLSGSRSRARRGDARARPHRYRRSSAPASPVAHAPARSPARAKRVRVYDARRRRGGCQRSQRRLRSPGAAARYDVRRETYGADAARSSGAARKRPSTASSRSRATAFRRTGSLRLAADVEETRRDPGRVRGAARGRLRRRVARGAPAPAADFRGAIFHPTDGAVQPAAFVQRLATSLPTPASLRRARADRRRSTSSRRSRS